MQYLVRNPYNPTIIKNIFSDDFIEECIQKSDHYTTIGDPNEPIGWKKVLDNKSFNNHKISSDELEIKMINREVVDPILPKIKKMANNENIKPSGYFIYPPSGFMGWHTNCNSPHIRLYITYASEDKKSFFRYRHPETKEIITDYDDKGITIRQFEVIDKPPYFWHCVGSDCIRISLGYRIL